jgi:hypothetical protein
MLEPKFMVGRVCAVSELISSTKLLRGPLLRAGSRVSSSSDTRYRPKTASAIDETRWARVRPAGYIQTQLASEHAAYGRATAAALVRSSSCPEKHARSRLLIVASHGGN